MDKSLVANGSKFTNDISFDAPRRAESTYVSPRKVGCVWTKLRLTEVGLLKPDLIASWSGLKQRPIHILMRIHLMTHYLVQYTENIAY